LTGGHNAARAVDALRRGWPVTLGNDVSILSVETADAEALAAFDPDGSAQILISAGRAATLKLTNQRAAAAPEAPVLVARPRWLGLAEATALADPQLDLATPMKGPFEAIPIQALEAAQAALLLARHAGLLPAFFIRSGGEAADTAIAVGDVAAYEQSSRLRIVTRARLPVAAAEHCEIVAFRTPEAGLEHIALLIGTPNGQPPLVRLHSECLTGDVLGSLKCDCGPQLDAALRLMAESGWGILLYLRQEGRSIGLINKLRAYALQDQGFDTVDANTRLGFAVDARDFSVAARMLSLLGQGQIRLLTNNPEKVARLAAEGIDVAERVPHKLPPNPHNQRYLDTKRDRTGHAL
jgi:GTP cyclohydrolase II